MFQKFLLGPKGAGRIEELASKRSLRVTRYGDLRRKCYNGSCQVIADLLTKKFRWPTAGDRLFDNSEHPCDDARIVPDQFARMVVMAAGYKEGADTLVQTAIDQGNKRDFSFIRLCSATGNISN